MRISDWSSDVCSSDLRQPFGTCELLSSERRRDLASSPGGGSGAGDEVGDHASELLALVLLEEVPAALDRGVGLARGAGHGGDELALAALGDRVAVAEGAQERPKNGTAAGRERSGPYG